MKLILQKERWTCGLAAFAMLLDEDPEELIMELGHNGSKVGWPFLPIPYCYYGFNTQEFVDLCYARGYGLIQITGQPVTLTVEGEEPKRIWESEKEDHRMGQYMTGNPGVVIGEVEGGNRHAVAWDGEKVYDPRGHIYRFDASEAEYAIGTKSFYPIAISEFLMLIKIKSSE